MSNNSMYNRWAIDVPTMLFLQSVAQITTFNSVCMKVLIYSFCIVFSRHRVLPSITAMSTARTLRIYSEEDPDLRVVLPERDPIMMGIDSERVLKVQRLKKMY